MLRVLGTSTLLTTAISLLLPTALAAVLLTGCGSSSQQSADSADIAATAVMPTAGKTRNPVPTRTSRSTTTSSSGLSATPSPSEESLPNVTLNEHEFGIGGLVKDLVAWADADLPDFITSSHIDIGNVATVSKFRSGAGHDFSDSYETCCSMKHYFRTVDYYGKRFTQPIYSPVDGVVLYLTKPTGPYADEWKVDYEQKTGKAPPIDYRDWNIFIRPDAAPNVWVTHMHLQPTDKLVDAIPVSDGQQMMRAVARPASPGYRVQAGDLIGHGLGEIIVKRHLDGPGIPSPCNDGDSRQRTGRPPGCRTTVQLHSIFEFMTEPVFRRYRELSDVSRSDFIISQEERTTNPLSCEGQFFINPTGYDSSVDYIHLQDSLEGGSELSLQQPQSLPGFSSLADGRDTMASFNGSGSQVLSPFVAGQPYFLVIATDGGPIEISVKNGRDVRIVYSRPSGLGVTNYEFLGEEPGNIEISVKADCHDCSRADLNWEIIAVKSR